MSTSHSETVGNDKTSTDSSPLCIEDANDTLLKIVHMGASCLSLKLFRICSLLWFYGSLHNPWAFSYKKEIGYHYEKVSRL